MRKFFLSLILALALITAPAAAQWSTEKSVTCNITVLEALELTLDFDVITFLPGIPTGEWIQANEGPLGVTCSVAQTADVWLKVGGGLEIMAGASIIPWANFAVTGTGEIAFPKTILTHNLQVIHTFTSSGTYHGLFDFEYLNNGQDPGDYTGTILIHMNYNP